MDEAPYDLEAEEHRKRRSFFIVGPLVLLAFLLLLAAAYHWLEFRPATLVVAGGLGITIAVSEGYEDGHRWRRIVLKAVLMGLLIPVVLVLLCYLGWLPTC